MSIRFLARCLWVVVLAFLLTPEVAASDEIVLPPGSEARGRVVFERSQCTRCHVHPSVSRPPKRGAYLLNVPLGGPTGSALSDEQLATELLRPSHRIDPGRMNMDEEDPELSPMPSFAKALSIQDLADIVAFLRPAFRYPDPALTWKTPWSKSGAAEEATPDPGGLVFPDGDGARGRRVFQRSRCTLCHEVAGHPMSPGVDQPPMRIPLGGDPSDRLSDTQIATEIASPSAWVKVHSAGRKVAVVGDSPMPNFTRHLSVQDLADLVEFLRPAFREHSVRPR